MNNRLVQAISIPEIFVFSAWVAPYKLIHNNDECLMCVLSGGHFKLTFHSDLCCVAVSDNDSSTDAKDNSAVVDKCVWT